MAFVFKRPNSPYWQAGFDVVRSDGQTLRVQKSTRQKKRADAVTEAARMEEVANRGATSSAEGGSKAYAVLSEAADAAARGELSEARAREMLAKITEASTGSTLKFYTLRTWANDWLAVKASTGKPATARRYSTSIKAFLLWMDERADSRLEAVTKADIRSFRNAVSKGWGGQPRSGATTNFYAADVASMFRAAVREGLLLASPSAALERLPEDDSMEREPFALADVSRLVEEAGKPEWQDRLFSKMRPDEVTEARCREWQGLILAGYYVGPRLGDCAALSWDWLRLPEWVISFVPSKTSRRKKMKYLHVPIHPRLKAFLMETPEEQRKGPIFPLLHARSVSGKTGLSAQFGAIMEQAGIDRCTVREAVKGKDGKVLQRSIQARTYHSMRHSLTTTLANLDVPEEIRMRITGHRSAETHQGYTHTAQETLARALEKLPYV